MKSRHSYGLCGLLEEEPEGGGGVMPTPMEGRRVINLGSFA